MLLLHPYMSPPKSGTFGAIGSGDSGLKPRRLRSDQSLRTKPRRLRHGRRLRCVWSGDSGLGFIAGFLKGLGVGSCFTTPHTPPTPTLHPAAAKCSKVASGRSPPPESAVPPASPPPKRWGSFSPPFGSHHEGHGYHSLSSLGFHPRFSFESSS